MNNVLRNLAWKCYREDKTGPWPDNAATEFAKEDLPANGEPWKTRKAFLESQWGCAALETFSRRAGSCNFGRDEEKEVEKRTRHFGEIDASFGPISRDNFRKPRTIRIDAGQAVRMAPNDWNWQDFVDWLAFVSNHIEPIKQGLEAGKNIRRQVEDYWSTHPDLKFSQIIDIEGIELPDDGVAW